MYYAMENEPVSKLARKQTLPVVRYLSKVATSYVNIAIDWFGKKNAWIEARCLLLDTKKGP